MSLDEIESVALELPETERAELIGRLQDSLRGESEPAAVAGYDPEWLEELDRRIGDVEAGAAGVPAEEVFARMRARRDAGPLPR